MADEPATPAEHVEADTSPQGEPALEEPGKKALVAERRARAAAEKEAKALKARLDEIEAEKLSKEERAAKEAADAKAEAQAARREALRWRIAARHGISDEDAELFLTGGDEQTLNQQAERLAERAKETAPAVGVYVPQSGHQPSAPALNGDDLEQALRAKLGIT